MMFAAVSVLSRKLVTDEIILLIGKTGCILQEVIQLSIA